MKNFWRTIKCIDLVLSIPLLLGAFVGLFMLPYLFLTEPKLSPWNIPLTIGVVLLEAVFIYLVIIWKPKAVREREKRNRVIEKKLTTFIEGQKRRDE